MVRARTLGWSLAALGLTLPALAVKTEVWTHEQPKQFTGGKLENVVVSSLGEVSLGRETKTLQTFDQKVLVINALSRAGDGKIYAATGPAGVIYQIDGKEVKPFATLPDGGTVFSLLFTQDGKLLAGTGGGKQARIYQIDGTGSARVFYEPKDAVYVWAMARGPGGEIYAATGIEGKLYSINPDGSDGKVLVDLKPKNLLSMAFGQDGQLYIGTDGDGLVYRINPTSGSTFVMYDAKESEISSIVSDAQGNLFVATASAEGARPGRSVADKPGGKPDGAASRPAGSTSKPATSAAEKPAREDAAAKPDEADEDDGDDEKPSASRSFSLAQAFGRPATASGGTQGGNAIYRISPEGFVTEVFREPVMILSLTEDNGTLYAATGNEGRIYAIDPANDRTTMLARLESKQATTMLRLPDGNLLLGTANPASVVTVSEQYASKGTLTSKPLDASQVVKWGTIDWRANTPDGTKVVIATRSSNVENEESDAWEEWETLEGSAPQQITSSNARFLQYRVTLETTKPDQTPTLRQLRITRIEENRAPLVTALDVVSAREEAQKPTSSSKVKALVRGGGFGEDTPTENPDHYWVIKWTAEDPNKDSLTYDAFYRELGSSKWIRAAKDSKEAFFIWDTRTVPDGKYEVRVVASDGRANPPGTELTGARVSDPVIVDNTPPEVNIDAVELNSKGQPELHAVAIDAGTPISEAAYSVNSSDEWHPLVADDGIFDTQREGLSFTVEGLEPGEHRIAIRVRDAYGNTRYVSKTVTTTARQTTVSR